VGKVAQLWKEEASMNLRPMTRIASTFPDRLPARRFGEPGKTPDLRAGVRIEASLRAELNSGDAWFACRLLDISDHGFLLVCNKALAVGQLLGLRCELYPEKLVECNVEVRHADETGSGVMIVEIDEKSIGFCQLYLQEHYSDQLCKSG